MVQSEQFFDLFNIYVNELIGDINLAFIFGFIVIVYISLRTKMNFQLSIALAVLWALLWVAMTEALWIWALIGLFIALFIAFSVARVFRRG